MKRFSKTVKGFALTVLIILVYIVMPVISLYWFVWGDTGKGFIFLSIFTAGVLAVILIIMRARKRTEALFAAMRAEHRESSPDEQLPPSIRDDPATETVADAGEPENADRRKPFRLRAVVCTSAAAFLFLLIVAIISTRG